LPPSGAATPKGVGCEVKALSLIPPFNSVRSMVTTIDTNCEQCGTLAKATFNPGNAAGGAHWVVIHDDSAGKSHEHPVFERPALYTKILDLTASVVE
jgi:hypothetical protein